MNTSKLLLLSSLLAAGVLACGDDGGGTGGGGTGGDSASSTTTGSGTTSGSTTTGQGAGGEGTGAGDTGGGDTGGGDTGGGGAGGSGPPAVPELGAQLERMGRPAINTATVDTFIVLTGDPDAPIGPSSSAVRDASEDDYNAAANLSEDALGFIPTQSAQLTVLDSLDGVCGNQPFFGFGSEEGQCDDSITGEPLVCYGALASVLNHDSLWVKTTYESCGVYLGVEADTGAALGDPRFPANEDCGGRRPIDDVILHTYSVVSGALGGEDIFLFDDNITPPADLHPEAFPYLAAPSADE